MGKHLDYRFHYPVLRQRELLIFLGFAFGSTAACIFAKAAPIANLKPICFQLTQGNPRLGIIAACSLLPLLLAAGFSALGLTPWNWLLPAVSSGFLFSFLPCAFLSAMGREGILLAITLLSSRAVSLCCLFWFLLRRTSSRDEKILSDLLYTSGIGVLSIFVYFWLFSPTIRELGQCILH